MRRSGSRFRSVAPTPSLFSQFQLQVAQLYELADTFIRVPLLGAVGPLQFDVLKYRLETEYGADCRLESAPWSIVRWLKMKEPAADNTAAAAPSATVKKAAGPVKPAVTLPTGVALAQDTRGAWVVLFPSAWSVRYFAEQNPKVELREAP